MRTLLILAGGLVSAAVTAGTVAFGHPYPALPQGAAQVELADADQPLLTPFDVQDPAIAGLEPALLSALQQAAVAASADGVVMTVTSGWRSPEFQRQLLDDAVLTYGSMAAARQYVQTPEHSRHVTGQAVDIGGVGADQWLVNHGAAFGLCQIYANELWHFELATAPGGQCPPLLPDASA